MQAPALVTLVDHTKAPSWSTISGLVLSSKPLSAKSCLRLLRKAGTSPPSVTYTQSSTAFSMHASMAEGHTLFTYHAFWSRACCSCLLIPEQVLTQHRSVIHQIAVQHKIWASTA